MKNRVRAVVVSNIGDRKNQEDNFLLGRHVYLRDGERKRMEEAPDMLFIEENAQDIIICAVTDGMGGHNAGEIASRQAVIFLDSFYDEIFLQMHNDRKIQRLFDGINQAIVSTSAGDTAMHGMGTTLCAAVVNSREVLFICAGDSRAYLYNGQLRQISEDHCEGHRLKKLGILTEDEIRGFPARKALYKYLGYDGVMCAELIREEISEQNAQSVILLCSDGFTDQVSDAEIAETLSYREMTIKEKAVFLVKHALQKPGSEKDNITLILIEITRSQP